MTVESTPTGVSFPINSVRCIFSGGVVYNYNTPTCLKTASGDGSGRQLVNISHQITNVKKDYYYKAYVSVQWPYSSIDGTHPVSNSVLYYPSTTEQWNLIKFQAISEGFQNYDNSAGVYDDDTYTYYSVIYEVVLRARNDYDTVWYNVGNGSNTLFYNPSVGSLQGAYMSLGTIEEYERVPQSVEAIEENTEAVNNPEYIDQEKEDLENQKQESEDTANDESSEAQDTATSLLDVIVQAISVFSSAQPTSCNIDGSLIPHLPLGTLNLCQNSPPPAITALGSILLIAFVVPLAFHLVKRMLALIGSFQN